MSVHPQAAEVLAFWFEELEPKQWWVKDPALDATIEKRFGELHPAASACELFEWRKTAAGRLAEVIVLDQSSRNLHRGTPRAFSQDPLALALAQAAVAVGADQQLPEDRRGFLYMPFMHSESPRIHVRGAELFGKLGEGMRDAAKHHRSIVDRFGRYPHRNEILGRASTAEELEFLKKPGSSF